MAELLHTPNPGKPSVFLTRLLARPAMDRLFAATDLIYNGDDRVLSPAELHHGIKGAVGLLSLLTDTVDAGLMDGAPELKVIANYAVGFNNIDLQAARERGITVTNTPGVLTEATADFAWTLLMACARRLGEGERLLRRGEFKGWGPAMLLGTDVHGKTLGLIGYGRIGRAMAKRATGFDMRVIYHDPADGADAQDQTGARAVSLDELLATADFVSLHVPYLPVTHHLINAERLAMMKPGAYLINTARGPVVDEAALVEALAGGKLAGAGLDVYEREPELHPGLYALENAVLAPHIASATVEARTAMAMLAVDNLLAVLEGRTPPTPVV